MNPLSPPVISVIINNYNYARFLPAAVDSALEQDYPHLEVIVVDDGSTDRSRDVIARYGERIVPVFKPNGGQASALNAGFQRARGDVIIFLDADDVLLPGVARRAAAAFEVQPSTAKLMWRMVVMDGHGRPTGEMKPRPHLPLRNGDLRREELAFPFDLTWMATSGNAFPAPVLRQLLPIPEDDYPILADYYLAHLAPLFGPVIFQPEPGACYRIHGANNHERVAGDLDPGAIRKNLLYAGRTLDHIRDTAVRLGLPGVPSRASDLLSVSLLSKRLVSLRLDPAGHPYPGDSWWGLLRAGLGAARRRFDVAPPMRLMFAGWFVAAALAPRSFIPWLVRLLSDPGRRGPLNRMLGLLHRRLPAANPLSEGASA